MKKYYRVMLGRKSVHAEACLAGGFIGTDFDLQQDLSRDPADDWRAFNRKLTPLYLARHPDKTKVADLTCGASWNLFKGIARGDIVKA